MTTYILTGGNDLRVYGYGSDLAREIYKTVKRPANVVSCFFATPSDFWPVKAKTWHAWFTQYFGEDVMWVYVTMETFISQVQDADVIYLHGGDNDLMREMLDHYPNLPTCFDRKIVVGSSAGANYLSRNYWARRKQQVVDGKGLISRSVIVHFESTEEGVPETDWANVVHMLTTPQEGPIVLREGQFQVIEQ